MSFRYRLSGEIDGRSYNFDLEDGDHRIGCSGESDVRLAFEGVSRQHALLRVLPGGVSIEDSGSRNGTFVDGSRVQKAAVGESSTLAIGPVELTLQAIEGGEAVAAIRLEAPFEASSSFASEVETPLIRKPLRSSDQGFLLCVETVLERLRGPAGRSGALAAVAKGYGSHGAWLVHWPPSGEPAVFGAFDELPTLPDRPMIDKSMREEGTGRLRWQGERAPLEMVSMAGGEGGVTGLIVEGAGVPGPHQTFLRVCLEILLGSLEPALAGDPRKQRWHAQKERRRLRFPPEYLPGTGSSMEVLYARARDGLAHRLAGPFLGRDRGRQGPAGESLSRLIIPRASASGGAELRSHRGWHFRSRAFRHGARSSDRRRCSSRCPAARPRRHAVPRRNRRDAAAASSEATACAPRARGTTSRQRSDLRG